MGQKVSNGKSVRVVVPISTVIVAGTFYLIDGFFGIALQSVTTDGSTTSLVTLSIEPAEYETDQITLADGFTLGAKVYFDAATKKFTTAASTNIFVGVVTVAKDANDVVRFNFMPNSSEVAVAGDTYKGYVAFNYPGTLTAITVMDEFTFNKITTVNKIKARVKTLPGATATLKFDIFNGANSIFTAPKEIASTDTANEFLEFTPDASPAKNVFAADGVLKIAVTDPGNTAAADLEVVPEFDQTI